MKALLLLLLSSFILTISSCYTIEEADNVNQDRIATYYDTEFNATRNAMTTRLDFRFGQTPLRLNNPIFFEDYRLYEKSDVITGLHYKRQIHDVLEGYYQWTDETGKDYINLIELFDFDLAHPVSNLQKGKYYDLPWQGDQIPYGNGYFVITIQSFENGLTCVFNVGNKIEILPEHLTSLPTGPATLIISRKYSEPIDEGTQAGGESTVSYKREYEITITE